MKLKHGFVPSFKQILEMWIGGASDISNFTSILKMNWKLIVKNTWWSIQKAIVSPQITDYFVKMSFFTLEKNSRSGTLAQIQYEIKSDGMVDSATLRLCGKLLLYYKNSVIKFVIAHEFGHIISATHETTGDSA